MESGVQLPLELRPFKTVVDRLSLSWSTTQLEQVVNETLGSIHQQEQAISNSRALRLVLRHDCQSTGCGESGCLLCQYNPSRLCKRNLKVKYLIDDHLKAKCGAPLRVELVDELGACVSEGLPQGTQLEVHVLNGEKYKEICPDNTLLSHPHLRSCVISHHQRALLKREGGSDEQLRCFLQLERGQGPLSDLQVTTSSEALLAGKAPTFRLLVWAVDALGEPVSNVTYVVSENFVVATKRVKHAIKSDIPSVADSVSKLVHIGKATVDKLMDLRGAAKEEGFEIGVPDELNRIDKVGQFQQLVEQSEMNSDLKNKVRHLLKLSPEKWEEVSQHALAAVVPDFRSRVWWCHNIRSGLLFACKNGSVTMEHPIALVKMGMGQGDDDQIIPIHQLDPVLFHTIPKLKQNAVQNWYAASHPGWVIYYKEGQDPDMAAMLQMQNGMMISSNHQLPAPPELTVQPGRAPGPSPFEVHARPPAAPVTMARTATSASPFAAPIIMSNISDAFPSWQNPPSNAGATEPAGGLDNETSLGGGSVLINTQMAPPANVSLNFPSLPMDLLKSDSILPGGTNWSVDPTRSSEWLTSGALQQIMHMQANQAGLMASQQQGGDSFVAEMEARKASSGHPEVLGGHSGLAANDRALNLHLNPSLNPSGNLDLMIQDGGSWRNAPILSESPAGAMGPSGTAAQHEQERRQVQDGNVAKRPKVEG